MKLNGRKRDFRANIVRLDRQRAIQHGFFFGVAPENSITERNLLERFSVARVKVARALQVLRRLLPASLAPLDVSHHLKYPRIIR